MDCGLIHWKPRGFSENYARLTVSRPVAADWADAWRAPVGTVHHAVWWTG